jgi:hypothetical protein
MTQYIEKELTFTFPDDLQWGELDEQGIRLPHKMPLVDLVIERERDILLIEIKDPSHSNCPENERVRYAKRLTDNSVLQQELTPKARNSYTFLHLMERDTKPFVYVVLLGLDAFEANLQKAILGGFKGRLMADISCETTTPWIRTHISDCVVLSVEAWNSTFADWPVTRIAPVAANEGAPA